MTRPRWSEWRSSVFSIARFKMSWLAQARTAALHPVDRPVDQLLHADLRWTEELLGALHVSKTARLALRAFEERRTVQAATDLFRHLAEAERLRAGHIQHA